jgi:hypothetical protein
MEKILTKLSWYSFLTLIMVVVIGGIMYIKPQSNLGSVGEGGTYKPYYTPSGGANYKVLKTSPGTLGSVVITGAGAGSITLYDATTTDVTKRALATTSLTVVAQLPASTAAGTYTFDANFYKGLAAVWSSTLTGTSTITYR